MKARLPRTLGRFAALVLVAAVFACDGGGTDPDPDPVNRAPVAAGVIPPLDLVEGESSTVDVSSFFSDPDGDDLTYSASSSDNAVLTVSVSGSNVTATAVAVGTVAVTITATDPGGLSASHVVTVTVLAANEAPVVTDTIPHQTLTEGDTLVLDVSGNFSDPDGDELTFTAGSDDTGVATVSVDGSEVTIVGVGPGAAFVTVTATDPGGLSASQAFAATVEQANRAPVAVGTVPDVGLLEGEEFTAPVDQFFSDPDGDSLAYAAVSGDTMVVTASMSGHIITVVAVGAGETTITLTATDPGGLSATQTANFTVAAVNQPPVAVGEVPDVGLLEGEEFTAPVDQFFSDPDGDSLAYAAVSGDTMVVTASMSGHIITVVAVGAGETTITLTATDPGGLSATQTANFTVAAANQPPVAVGTVPDVGLHQGETFTAPVDQFFSDPDGDSLAYAAVSGDTMVVTASMSGHIITVVAVGAGETTITLTATDPGGLSATQTANFTVAAVNQPPVAVGTVPDVGLHQGETFTAPVDQFFSDPDGDTLAYAAVSGDTMVVTASMAGTMITVVALAEGETTITLTATDPGGLSATQTATVRVVGVNNPPVVVEEIPHATIAVGDTLTLDVSGNFSDPDGDELAFTVESDDTTVATVSVDGSTVTVVGVAPGAAIVGVTATDPGGLSATQTFDVTVPMPNQAPEISDTVPVHDLFITLDTLDMTMTDTVTMVVLDMADYFNDPDGDELTYTASTVLDTMAAVEPVEGSVVTTIAVAADTALLYDTTMLMVTATDPDGLSVTQEAMVRVAASDYEVWDDFKITDEGKFVFAGLGLSGCFMLDEFSFSGQVYTVHWSEWQVKKGSGWVQVPGTYKELEVCAYPDLPDAPDGTYRLVGDVSIRPLAGTEDDWVRARRKSENEIEISN